MMTRTGSSFIAITLLMTITSGCSTTYTNAPNRPALPPGNVVPTNVIFVSNTSRVDFDDLIVVHATNPAIEGFFDQVYPLAQLADLPMMPRHPDAPCHARSLQDGNHFIPEAEWLLVFKDPLSEDSNGLSDVLATFVPMVEGKFTDELRDRHDKTRNDWIPASGGNNFADIDQSPLGWKPLKEWNRLFESGTDPILSSSFTISYPKRFGFRHTRFKTSLKSIRKDLFKKDLSLIELIESVQGEFHRYDETERSALQLVGVNLGAHGRKSAHVSSPARMLIAATPALFSFLWDCKTPVTVRTKRNLILQTVWTGGAVKHFDRIEVHTKIQ